MQFAVSFCITQWIHVRTTQLKEVTIHGTRFQQCTLKFEARYVVWSCVFLYYLKKQVKHRKHGTMLSYFLQLLSEI